MTRGNGRAPAGQILGTTVLWPIVRLGHIGRFTASGIDKITIETEVPVKMVNYTDVYGNVGAQIDRRATFMETTAPREKAVEHALRLGDVLFTPSSETADDIGWAAVVTEPLEGVVYSYHLTRWRPAVELDVGFTRYALNSRLVRAQLTRAAKGTTRQILTRDDFRSLRISLPSIGTQRAVASYLDAETARIDTAMDLRRRTITLLDEKTSAVLEAAFTSASTRRTKLKHLLAQSPCYGVLVPNFVDVGVPFVRVGDLTAMGAEDVPARHISESQSREYARTRLASGDILLSVVGSIDKVRVVSPALAGSNIARAVCRLLPLAGVPSDLLALWFRTTAYLHQARKATSSDTAQPTLGMGDLADFEVWFPEPNAYDEFQTRLQQKLDSLAAARNSLQRQVYLLTDRRQALITAAVTGQFEIPGVAA